MSNDLAVFIVYQDRYVLMHIKDNRAEDIYVYQTLDGGLIGAVINCMPVDHIDNINASFVRYAKDQTGFINKRLKGGTCTPLMYKKDAYGDKKALFTDRLSISGTYTVVVDSQRFVRASSKAGDEAKNSMISKFASLSESENIGIILRTRAFTEDDGEDKAKKEIKEISDLLSSIKEKSLHSSAYTILYRPLPEYIEDMLYLIDQGIEEIVTDDPMIRDALSVTYSGLSQTVNVTDRVSLRFYEDKLIKLCNLYAFNAKISEALSRKVYLKSGAYITFDTTEALTAVDVNSSGSRFASDKEDVFLSINLEACEEIARQIRIRNISGMIIIDYINMKSEDSYRKLKECMIRLFNADRRSCRFVDFTKLMLCEAVRTRSGISLYEAMNQRSK